MASPPTAPQRGSDKGADKSDTLFQSVREHLRKAFEQDTTTFMVKTGWLALLLVGLAWAYVRVLTQNEDTSRVELSFSGDHPGILIERREPDKVETERLFLLYPQDWLNTGILIQAGDSVVVTADGRINLSIHRLLDAILHRRKYEADLRDSLARVKSALPASPDFRPEEYYSQMQIDSVRGSFPWSDPDGIPNAIRDLSTIGRTQMKLAPDQNYGKLLGLLRTSNDDAATPTRSEFAGIFPIGRYTHITPSAGGYLWLAVNDVWSDYTKGGYPRLFFDDNIGSFGVRVLVRHFAKASRSSP